MVHLSAAVGCSALAMKSVQYVWIAAVMLVCAVGAVMAISPVTLVRLWNGLNRMLAGPRAITWQEPASGWNWLAIQWRLSGAALGGHHHHYGSSRY